MSEAPRKLPPAEGLRASAERVVVAFDGSHLPHDVAYKDVAETIEALRAILAALPNREAAPREGLDREWAALRNGLSKAYVAKDIDNALATARPRIEAALREALGR